MESKGAFRDKLELYRIDRNGHWDLDLQTETNLNPLKRILRALGLYRCIDDALTDHAIKDLTTYITTKYAYASVGTDDSDGTNYTLTDLKSPVMSRFPCTISTGKTYIDDDTAIFTSIVESTEGYTLTEFGLHDALTDGNMGARQVSCAWEVADGETFGMIWRIVTSRG